MFSKIIFSKVLDFFFETNDFFGNFFLKLKNFFFTKVRNFSGIFFFETFEIKNSGKIRLFRKKKFPKKFGTFEIKIFEKIRFKTYIYIFLEKSSFLQKHVVLILKF